jgi:hypothetical protein
MLLFVWMRPIKRLTNRALCDGRALLSNDIPL